MALESSSLSCRVKTGPSEEITVPPVRLTTVVGEPSMVFSSVMPVSSRVLASTVSEKVRMRVASVSFRLRLKSVS